MPAPITITSCCTLVWAITPASASIVVNVSASTRSYAGLSELDYPRHDKTVTVTTCGRICFNRQKINLSTVFAGASNR